MNEDLLTLATDISRLTSARAVWSRMSALANDRGMPFCTLTMARRDDALRSSRFMTNLPDEFQDNYCKGGQIDNDPFLSLICQSMAPRRITTNPAHFPGTEGRQDQFLELTRSLGVKSAICVPVKTNAQSEFGGWVIGGTSDEIRMDRSYLASCAEMQLAGLLAFERLPAISHQDCSARNRLSPRERECLLWLSNGLRVAMIAHRLGLSESAVSLYIRNARRKLGAQTREQAVARAILNGEIRP